MKDEDFAGIAAGLEDAIAFVQGDETRGRVAAGLDVKAIRAKTKLSQVKFAAKLRVPVATLRDWEQHRRSPDAPARTLLRMVDADPPAAFALISRDTRPPEVSGSVLSEPMMPQTTMHEILMGELDKIPVHYLARLLAEKSDALGHHLTDETAQDFAAHILSGSHEPFRFGDEDDDDDLNVTLDITEDDIREIVAAIDRFSADELPTIFSDIAQQSAKHILDTLKEDWPAQKHYDVSLKRGFVERLERDWSPAFDILRMMLTISREIGPETSAWVNTEQAQDTPVRYKALLKTHARACQVTDEIICLLENGFADGAFARWRTLHELTVIATFLAEGDEELAARYFDHELVESKRAMDHFKLHYESLGYDKPDDADISVIEKAYEETLDRYERGFGSDYGWAAPHLGKKRVQFRDIEESVGQAATRSYYKFASYNVHASAKGINYRLGLIDQDELLLAGPSNVGFSEPAINTADSLCQVNKVIMQDRWTLDTITTYHILLDLWASLPDACHAAEGRIGAREEKRKRELSKGL